jgi:SulP family sulfate permease
MVEQISDDARGGASRDVFPALMKTFVRDLLAALVLFPVSATYILSYTALVYSGSLASHRPEGLAAMLVTTLVAGLLTALASSFRFAFGTLDNNATAVMVTVAASIAAEMGAGAHPDSVLATVMVGMAIAGVASGGAMLAIGVARAGS